MKKKILIIIIWLACSGFNWGAYLGDITGKSSYLYSNPRRYYGITAGLAVLGPFTTVLSPFLTNFYYYGFKWK